MTPSDNEELIQRLRQQDADAFVQIVRTFEQPMLRTAYRILGQQADAEEVRQTILLRIWSVSRTGYVLVNTMCISYTAIASTPK